MYSIEIQFAFSFSFIVLRNIPSGDSKNYEVDYFTYSFDYFIHI